MRFYYILIVSLFLIPSVLGFQTIQYCINDSFIQTVFAWQDCTSSGCTDHNITQPEFNCTSGCDTNLNQCKYELKSDMSYIATPIVISFITCMFFILGMKIQTSEEFSLFKNGIQTLFFFLGLWFLLLDMGTINAINIETGVSSGMSNLIGTGMAVMTWIIYFVMILFIVSYLIVAIMMMLPKKKKPFQA